MNKQLHLATQVATFTFLCCLLLQPFSALRAQGFWTNFNGPEGLDIKRLFHNTIGHCYAVDYQGRLFQSLDNGQTWTALSVPTPIRPSIKDLLTVGFDGTLFCLEPPSTMWHSTDLGATWTVLDHPLGDDIYTCTTLPNGATVCTGYKQVYWKPDGGIWYNRLQIFDDLGNFDFFQNLAWMPDSTVVVMVEHESSFTGRTILRSDVDCILWDTLPGGYEAELPIPLSNGHMLTYQDITGYWSITHKDFDQPQNFYLPSGTFSALPLVHHDTIYAGQYKSTDFGATWQPTDYNVYNIKHRYTLPGNTWIRSGYPSTTDRSQNLGADWCRSDEGAHQGWLYNWTFSGGKMWCHGTSGLWRSDDNGQNWTLMESDECVSGTTTKSIYNLVANANGTLFMARANGTFRSDDGGQTQVDITPTVVPTQVGRVSVHPNTGQLYAIADSFLLVADAQGQNWEIRNQGAHFYPHHIVFHPAGTLYAVRVPPNQGAKLMRSDDDGATWSEVPVSPPYNLANEIVVGPNGELVVGYLDKVYSSTDNGASWSPHPVPIDVSGLAFDATGALFVHSIYEPGIYKSNDLGGTWQMLSSLPGVPGNKGVMSIAISPDQRLWVCTNNYGRFRTTGTVGTTAPSTADAPIQLTPNPATHGVWVQGKSNAPARIEVVDAYGRTVFQTNAVALPYFIPVENWAKGTYGVKVLQEKGLWATPLVIAR